MTVRSHYAHAIILTAMADTLPKSTVDDMIRSKSVIMPTTANHHTSTTPRMSRTTHPQFGTYITNGPRHVGYAFRTRSGYIVRDWAGNPIATVATRNDALATLAND